MSKEGLIRKSGRSGQQPQEQFPTSPSPRGAGNHGTLRV